MVELSGWWMFLSYLLNKMFTEVCLCLTLLGISEVIELKLVVEIQTFSKPNLPNFCCMVTC